MEKALIPAEWNERRCPCLNMLIYDQTQSNPAFCTSAGRRKSSGYNRNGVHFFRNERRCSMLSYAGSIKLTRLYIKSAGIVNVSCAYDFFENFEIFMQFCKYSSASDMIYGFKRIPDSIDIQMA